MKLTAKRLNGTDFLTLAMAYDPEKIRLTKNWVVNRVLNTILAIRKGEI